MVTQRGLDESNRVKLGDTGQSCRGSTTLVREDRRLQRTRKVKGEPRTLPGREGAEDV